MKKTDTQKPKATLSPSRQLDARIKELGDWRGDMLARLRALIHDADPDVEETWKWRGVPVFEHDGIICTGETYKAVVKLTFANGAALDDPSRLFNSSLEGNQRRAIDFHEGDKVARGRSRRSSARRSITIRAKRRNPPARNYRSVRRSSPNSFLRQ